VRVPGRPPQDLQRDDVIRHLAIARTIHVREGSGTERRLDLITLVDHRADAEHGLAWSTLRTACTPRIERKGLQQQALTGRLLLLVGTRQRSIGAGETCGHAALHLARADVQHEGDVVRVQAPRKTQLQHLGVVLGDRAAQPEHRRSQAFLGGDPPLRRVRCQPTLR
jgi:hypothetical protein